MRSGVLPVPAKRARVSVPQLIEPSLYYRWLDSEQDALKILFARRHAARHVDERKGAGQLAAGKNKTSGGGQGFAEVSQARLDKADAGVEALFAGVQSAEKLLFQRVAKAIG